MNWNLPAVAAKTIEPLSLAGKGIIADLPVALKVLWTIWLTAVMINLAVWTMVSIGSGLTYFWPIWVAGPAGAALLGVTLGVETIRRGRRHN
ncbi:MAG: hypothetical protein DLM58_03115 [Pseudonocardiales bacterium]|nr:MAG: hypothetical protein DLM58_03115 [Pseudonocardiales bacterium]